MLKNHLLLFTKATDAGPGGGPTTRVLPDSGNKEDVIEFLGSDDDEPETIPLEEKKKETTDKTKEKEDKDDDKTTRKTKTGDPSVDDEPEVEDDDEDDELKAIEEELEEPTDDKLELVTPVRRREILKKYPQLFKDFPYLEKAYYREQQFTELFPMPEDAKIAVEKSEMLDTFEKDVMNGNTERILKAAKETDANAFHKIVDDYLPTLARVDEQAYFHVLGNVTKYTIYTMVQEGRRTNNEEMLKAAQLVNQFVFGNSEWKPPTNLAKDVRPEDKEKENKLSEREQGFVRQQFESSVSDLNTRVNNVLRNTIEANIDPRESMTDYVRRNASRDAQDSLETLINQDTRFKTLVDKLWEKAFESNFSRESVDRIRSAYVSKAKTLLPAVIKKARNEALRGIGKRVRDDDSSDETTKKGPIAAGRPRSQDNRPSGKVKEAKDIPRGMSTLEFLNSD